MDVNSIKQSWLYNGILPTPEELDTLLGGVLHGRDRQTAKIFREIAQGRPRLHDGETRHLLRARNQLLLEKSFSRSARF
jgi:hypothetical protein